MVDRKYSISLSVLDIKYIEANEHERLSNFTIGQKPMQRGTATPHVQLPHTPKSQQGLQ